MGIVEKCRKREQKSNKGNPPCHLEENVGKFTIFFLFVITRRKNQLKISLGAGETLKELKPL